MAKRVVAQPNWINAKQVIDIYSVSRCVSSDFADYINFWRHNGYWLFDSPDVISEVAEANSIDLRGTTLFYYEVFENEYDENTEEWKPVAIESSFKTEIVPPPMKVLEGFDVVTFYAHTSPECSPLSCNSLATQIATNEHCLLASFEDARNLVQNGAFDDSEPGPFRIFAVYSTGWPRLETPDYGRAIDVLP